LSLVPELRKQAPDCRLVYIGWKGEAIGDRKQFDIFDKSYFISAGKYRRYYRKSWWHSRDLIFFKTYLLNIRDGFRLARGTIQAYRLLGKIKPDVVFSKGSFVAVPVGTAARWRGVPIVTHDSDIIPGLANRLIGRWASVHATGFPVENYNYPKTSTHYVGVPIDSSTEMVDSEQLEQFRQKLGLPKGDLILMVGGAGHGSGVLNDLTVETAPALLEQFRNLQILHLTGAKHLESVKAAYQNSMSAEQLKRIHVTGYTTDFVAYSGSADLIVSRAGASSLALFASQAKACLIIPAHWLPGGHQVQNANYLKMIGAIESAENDIRADDYLQKIVALLKNPKRRQELGSKLHNFSNPDASQRLATLIISSASTK